MNQITILDKEHSKSIDIHEIQDKVLMEEIARNRARMVKS